MSAKKTASDLEVVLCAFSAFRFIGPDHRSCVVLWFIFTTLLAFALSLTSLVRLPIFFLVFPE